MPGISLLSVGVCWSRSFLKCPTGRFHEVQKHVSRWAGEDSPECSTFKTPASCPGAGFPVDFALECCHKSRVQLVVDTAFSSDES